MWESRKCCIKISILLFFFMDNIEGVLVILLDSLIKLLECHFFLYAVLHVKSLIFTRRIFKKNRDSCTKRKNKTFIIIIIITYNIWEGFINFWVMFYNGHVWENIFGCLQQNLAGGEDLQIVPSSYIQVEWYYIQRWRGHLNWTYCNWIHSNYLQSKVLGILKYHSCACSHPPTHSHPRATL